MLNPYREIKWNPGRRELRAFGWSLVLGFPCVALLFLLAAYAAGKGWRVSLAAAVGGGGVGAGLCFVLWPAVARPFYLAWYAIAASVSLVVGNLLLALVYYGAVSGLGLLRRACGARAIRKRPDPGASTYWREVDHRTEPRQYYRQF